MYTVPKFVPKIIEYTPDEVFVHENMDAYLENYHTYATAKGAHLECRDCREKFRTRADANRKPCKTYRSVPDPEYKRKEGEGLWASFCRRSKTVQVVKHTHSLFVVARVTNELGDDLELYVKSPSSAHRRHLRTTEQWLESSISPHNRGLLPHERNDGEYAKKHRHITPHILNRWYRGVNTTNEHRQYAATLVDDNAPKIRGRRGRRGLPTAYDDQYVHIDRSWKNKKVRKQWKSNL